LRPASYTLSKEEKESIFGCLNSMKVPSGYSSNIQGRINMKEKFTNLMSHDCHVLMTQLLPVALRGILMENVRLTIVKLCAFLNKISQKAIDPNKIIKLQNNMVQYLVSFEMVFPPSFFNIMTHLLVPIVKEINIIGPVFLHNIFPFERYMAVLKKYICNHSHLEGCIAKCRCFTATPTKGYPRGCEFVGRVSTRSETRRCKGTQDFRKVRAAESVIPYILCGLYCL
jgi:hypothetical protein